MITLFTLGIDTLFLCASLAITYHLKLRGRGIFPTIRPTGL